MGYRPSFRERPDPAHKYDQRFGTTRRLFGVKQPGEVNEYGRPIGTGSGVEPESSLSPAGLNTPKARWNSTFPSLGGAPRAGVTPLARSAPALPTLQTPTVSSGAIAPAAPTSALGRLWGGVRNTAVAAAKTFAAPANQVAQAGGMKPLWNPASAPVSTPAPAAPAVPSPAPPIPLDNTILGWGGMSPESRAEALRIIPAQHSTGVTTAWDVDARRDPGIKMTPTTTGQTFASQYGTGSATWRAPQAAPAIDATAGMPKSQDQLDMEAHRNSPDMPPNPKVAAAWASAMPATAPVPAVAANPVRWGAAPPKVPLLNYKPATMADGTPIPPDYSKSPFFKKLWGDKEYSSAGGAF